jgi:hypothetical protein
MNKSLWILVLAGVSCSTGVSTPPADGVTRPGAFTGPVGISTDHRSFVDGDGRPCFWLGDTLWELFTAYPVEEAETILEDRRSKGFNAIQVMLLGVGGGKKPNVSGEKPFVDDAVSTPNEAYFSRIDSIVRIAAKKNLVLVIGLYHKSPEYGKLITRENARAWGAWIGRRYRSDRNVIWSMYPEAKNSYLPLVRELAAGLAEGDGGSHRITVHPDPSPASSSWIHDEPWLSFNTLQSFKSTHLNYEMVAADYARRPVKPAVNGEARYEVEGGTTPLNIRNGAWWSCLAGGFYSFGHGGNWMKPAEWRNWIDSPASRQMKILGDFFRSLDWWTLVPDQAVISGVAGEKAAARSSSRDWAIVYLPSGGTVTVDLASVKAPVGARVRWINPATAETLSAGTFPASGTRPFTAPEGWTDAVLLVTSTVK